MIRFRRPLGKLLARAEYVTSIEAKDYITSVDQQALKDELYRLVHKEHPEIMQVVSQAVGNGDRSENGDYLYGKRRMRGIGRRIRFLTEHPEAAVMVDSKQREPTEQVFPGAAARLLCGDGSE